MSATAEGRPDRRLPGLLAMIVAVGCVAAGRWAEGLLAAALLWFGAAWATRGAALSPPAFPHEGAAPPNDGLPAELGPVLAGLERLRLQTAATAARRLRTRLPAGIAVGVLGWTALQFTRHPPGFVILGLVAAAGAAAGWALAADRLSASVERRYADEVLPRLAAALGALAYRRTGPPEPATLRAQRLFAAFDRVSAADEIVGTRHGIAVSIVGLELESRSGDDACTVFRGLLGRITLPMALHGTTLILPAHDAPPDPGGARVEVDDAAFAHRFGIWSTEPASARVLTTPSVRRSLITIADRPDGGDPRAQAADATLTVAIPGRVGPGLLAAPALGSADDGRPALTRLYGLLQQVLVLVEAVAALDPHDPPC